MATEKLFHEKYWARMARTTRIVDSWSDWEKGSPNNIRILETRSAATSSVDSVGAVGFSEKVSK